MSLSSLLRSRIEVYDEFDHEQGHEHQLMTRERQLAEYWKQRGRMTEKQEWAREMKIEWHHER